MITLNHMQNNQPPLVSVILPVYNRASQINKAINSVINQSYMDWELIIIDDCSSDNSFQIASSFKDDRIRVLKTNQNSGAAVARNLGIAHSAGSLISFIDSDDYYELEFLLQSVKKISEADKSVGFCWTGCVFHRVVKRSGVLIKGLWEPKLKDNAYLTFLNQLSIGTNSGITIKREVFNTVGVFDENLPAAEDTDLFLRITKRFNFTFVSEYLIHINQTESDRLSRRFDKIAIAYNRIIPKHLEVINKHKNLRLKFFYKAMWLNYHLGDRKLARSYFIKTIQDRFFFMNAWFIFLLFELGGKRLGSKIHVSISNFL